VPEPKPQTSFREYPALVGFFYWWLKVAPAQIYLISKQIIIYFYKYFSIPILFKTLFDPWKKDEIDTTNMALDDIIKVKFMNLVSRLVGAAVRSMTIAVGLVSVLSVIVLSFCFLVGFILLPIIVIFLIINALGRF
jgi:hypothetical protein